MSISVGSGGGFDFDDFQEALEAGNNITITASAADQTLTVAAAGSFPASGAMANASDASFSTLSDGQILVRSGTAFRNRTASGDATIDKSGNITLTTGSVTGSKIADKGVSLAKLTDTASSGNVLVVSANNTVSTTSIYSLVNSTLSAGTNVSFTNSSNTITVSATNTQRSDAEILTIISNSLSAGSNITITKSNGIFTFSGQAGGGGGVSLQGNVFGGTGINVSNSGSNGVVINSTVSGRRTAAEFANSLNTSLSGGSNITLTKVNNTITISSTASGGGGSTTFSGLDDTDVSNAVDGQIPIWGSGTLYNETIKGDATLTTSGNLTIGAKKVTLAKMHGGTSSARVLGTGSATDGTVNAITISAGDNVSVTHSDNVITISGQAAGGGG